MGQRRTEVGGYRITLLGTGANPGTFQPLLFQLDAFALGAERCPTRIVDQAQLATFFGQAQIGVVFAQDQAVFGLDVNIGRALAYRA